ncbi:glycosyltransferase [Microbacterium sp. F2]|uniref:glycosyltransferase n=1 Tax=Microbacterium sp. F2 TaxID=3422228 RepID=UPI003FD432D7
MTDDDTHFHAWGKRQTLRNNASISEAVPKYRRFSEFAIKVQRAILGVEFSLLWHILRSDVVVFHGFQRNRRMRVARRLRRTSIYMPHSPSVAADEYLMLQRLSGNTIDASMVDKLREGERLLFAMSDWVVFPCVEASSEYIASFGNELAQKRVSYIASGVDGLSSMGHSNTQHSPEPVVLFVGRYVTHKGYDLYLSAAREISNEGVSARFESLGVGPIEASDNCVVDLGWSENPGEHIQRASVVVVPNRIAYFDLLPLEVASLGKPLVLTAVGGNIAQAKALPHSVMVDTDSLSEGIIEALNRIRADPRWGWANRDVFDAEFTSVEMARRWLSFIRRVRET